MRIPQPVTTVSDVDSSDWKYVLEVNQPLEDWESDVNVKLAGEALAFYEAIKADGAITLTSVEDVEIYVDYLLIDTWGLIPDNGIVDEDLHASITDRIEKGFEVKLEDEALAAFDFTMKSWYSDIADHYNY